MSSAAKLIRQPSSLIAKASAEIRNVLDALANPIASAAELGACARSIGRAYDFLRSSRTMLTRIRGSDEAYQLLLKAQAKNPQVTAIRRSIIERLNAMRDDPLDVRILRILEETPWRTTAAIAAELTQQNRDIENARAEWRLALGTKATFVWPAYISSDEAASLLKTLRKQKRVRRRLFSPKWAISS